jgi:hypothetical protein
MHVIIEPLSEQAWMRVETQLFRRLAKGSALGSAPERCRPLPRAREVALAIASMRHRLESRWDDLRSDSADRRGTTAPLPEGGFIKRPIPLRNDAGTAPSRSIYRTYRNLRSVRRP